MTLFLHTLGVGTKARESNTASSPGRPRVKKDEGLTAKSTAGLHVHCSQFDS